MKPTITSIRPFVGSADYTRSKTFYTQIGFSEVYDGGTMCFLEMHGFGFYLQDAYVKDWVDNTMLFLEVEDPQSYLDHLKSLELPSQYKRVRLSEIVVNDWGEEFFLHDPSGVLWHIGRFSS